MTTFLRHHRRQRLDPTRVTSHVACLLEWAGIIRGDPGCLVLSLEQRGSYANLLIASWGKLSAIERIEVHELLHDFAEIGSPVEAAQCRYADRFVDECERRRRPSRGLAGRVTQVRAGRAS